VNCPICKIPILSDKLAEVPEDVLEHVEEFESFVPFATSIEHSTKVDALIKDLKYVRAQDLSAGSVTKSVVFSQFTALLTLLEDPLKKAGFKFVRMDGSMSRIQRSNALTEFKNNNEVCIFLLSIKAGGVGLNLVAASRVYLMEPYWNPAVEQQAIDRVHRLGQTKEVTTIRFIIKNSIEENMQKRQKYKMALAQKALSEDVDDELGTTDKRKRKRSPVNKEAILMQKLESISILFQ
jgi:SNF2 family DNA or RNA helicase